MLTGNLVPPFNNNDKNIREKINTTQLADQIRTAKTNADGSFETFLGIAYSLFQ